MNVNYVGLCLVRRRSGKSTDRTLCPQRARAAEPDDIIHGHNTQSTRMTVTQCQCLIKWLMHSVINKAASRRRQ